jgi:hypothetical protein
LAGCETLQTCKMAVHGATAIFRAFKFSPCNLAARCRASGVAAPTGSREILVLGEGRVAASPSGMFSIVTAGPGAGNLIFQTLQKVAPQPYSTFFQHPPSAVGGSGRAPTANPAPFEGHHTADPLRSPLRDPRPARPGDKRFTQARYGVGVVAVFQRAPRPKKAVRPSKTRSVSQDPVRAISTGRPCHIVGAGGFS